MIFTKLVLFTTLASAGRYVAAVPIPEELGADAQLQVVERDVDDVYSYDLERRAKGGALCMPMTKEDVKKLPGWSKFESIAKSKWGNGKYELVVNPEDYPDRPANICGQTRPVVIKAGKPSCQKNKSTVAGKLTGTNGSVQVGVTTGTNYQVSTSVTKEASIGTSMTSTVGIEFEGLAKVEHSFTFSSTFTNSIGKSTSNTQNNQQTSQITVESKDGKTCDLSFDVENCTIQGKGSFKYIADGHVWFNFHSKTNGHYKWALKLSELSEADRSSSADIEALVKAESKGQYKGVCTGKPGKSSSKDESDAKKNGSKKGSKSPAKLPTIKKASSGGKKAPSGGKKSNTPAKKPTKATSSKPTKKPASTAKPTKK